MGFPARQRKQSWWRQTASMVTVNRKRMHREHSGRLTSRGRAFARDRADIASDGIRAQGDRRGGVEGQVFKCKKGDACHNHSE